MSSNNLTVVQKTLDASILRELVSKYLAECGHKTNQHCCLPRFEKDGNSFKAICDIEDPKNPAKTVKHLKKSEILHVLASAYNLDLATTEIRIDDYS